MGTFKDVFSGLKQYLATERIGEKLFLFQLKSSFCSQDFQIFVLTFCWCRKTAWLGRQGNFKIYDVTTWETNNCNTHIVIISRHKGHKTMKFGQLIEYSMRYIFLENSYAKCGEETISRPFSIKNKIEHISESLV